MTNGGGRVIESGRYRNLNDGGIFGTITSSMSSGGDHRQTRQGKVYGREVRTHHPQASGYERISYGSGSEVLHNLPGGKFKDILLGTIGSGGTDGEAKNMAQQHMKKQDSSQSFFSSVSKNDGGPIDPEKILKCEETRTNIMVKNIPCRYTNIEIKQDFDQNHKNRYNDLKLPMDKQMGEKTNKAYCFINFRNVLYVFDFFKNKEGYHWPKYDSSNSTFTSRV